MNDGRPYPAPPPTTPLDRLPVVILDTETTGLDTTSARIVSIAGFRAEGRRLADGPLFDRLIDPGIAIPRPATIIHGIDDARVVGAPCLAEAWPDLGPLLDGVALVGHAIAFDVAILARETATAGILWRSPPCLDIGALAAGVFPDLVEVSLEALAARFGLEIDGRHTALGDARATAQIYLRLLPLLAAAGVRTLGEASIFSERAAARLTHPRSIPGSDFSRVDAFPYQHRVGDVMSQPAITTGADTTLHGAAVIMRRAKVGSLLVSDDLGRPIGIVTESDVLSAVASDGAGALENPIKLRMSTPVAAVPAEALIAVAIGRMDRLGIRHLAVVSPGNGRLVGVLSARALLHQRASRALAIADEVAVAADAAALGATRARLPDLARGLLAERLSATDVASVLSAIQRDINARAAELAAAAMARDGLGPAPAAWCFLVLGSVGRGEALLAPDQDNALVHAGQEDKDDAWFAELGRRTATLLAEAGIPYCRGKVMASEKTCRHGLAGWEQHVETWLTHPGPETFLNTDIFFDFVPVFGDRRLAASLRALATEAAATAPLFLNRLGHDVLAHDIPLGVFGRLRTKKGRFDAKHGGLAPITASARLLALRWRIAATGTAERLRAAAAAGQITDDDAAAYAEAHDALLGFLLDQQIRDLSAGQAPNAEVDVATLGPSARARLRLALERARAITAAAVNALAPT